MVQTCLMLRGQLPIAILPVELFARVCNSAAQDWAPAAQDFLIQIGMP